MELRRRCYLELLLPLLCLCAVFSVITCDKHTHITSLYACTDIKFRFATTRVTSHVFNPSNQSRTANFDINLPNDAFISNFTLEINNKVYVGRVEEREQALKRYALDSSFPDDASSAARVTQRPRETNQFRVTLKVGPGAGVTFNLTYQEILERRLGYYDHVLYIDPGQPVDDMRVDVSIEENREITYLHVPPIRRPGGLITTQKVSERNSLVRVQRPSNTQAFISYHPSARHQQLQGRSRLGLSGLFTVRYDVNRTMDAGELLNVNGFFVHFIAPPVREAVHKDVLFILDTSTSMMWQKLGQLQDAMRVILQDLAPGDRFALMQFNSRATFWRRELLPVNSITIAWALEYVQSLKARGYTNIDSSLAQGLQFLNEQESVQGDNALVIFLTDGRPTRGETDSSVILKNVRAQNQKQVAVYGLAFGKDADWPLVKRLASQNHGMGRRIYQDSDAALQIQGFYAEVSSLLLTGVRAVYLDSEVDLHTLTRALFKQYFNGSELIVAGKLVHINQTALQVFVEATGVEGQVNLTMVPDPDPVVPGQVKSCGVMQAKDVLNITEKMWAYLTIRQMLQRRVGEDDEAARQDLKKKALELALMHSFVTPVTSLVVEKPSGEELAFLQEDDSDLLDESDNFTLADSAADLTSSTVLPNGVTNSGVSTPGPRGGGGGDPHFMIELASLPYPLCYDVRGNTSDVFRLLRDPVSGLTVNIQLSEGHSSSNTHSRLYITRAAILLQDVIADVSTETLQVDDVTLRWDQNESVYMLGVWIIMANGTLRFALDSGVEIDVTRHVGVGSANQDRQNSGDDFLNVEVQNESHLSPDSTGLLGQFVHKDITVSKFKKRDGRVVAELTVRNNGHGEGGSDVRRGRAVLKTRRDPYFRRQATCLMVGSLWSHVLDRPTRFYRLNDMFEI